LNKRKGIDELIKAVEILKGRGITITCLVFGHGNFEQNENIRFVQFGNIASEEMLSAIYNAADVFVMPSLEEAFGQTCLEAMSCGVPVVAFDTGGIPDMIVNQETGLLAEKGNHEDLANQILVLFQNVELRKKISANSRRKVVESFNLKLQASKYYDLYRKVLN
jgi:glycosyltransferase involved in cell wall biosynthesis